MNLEKPPGIQDLHKAPFRDGVTLYAKMQFTCLDMHLFEVIIIPDITLLSKVCGNL